MSSSGEVALQQRHLEAHAHYGQRLIPGDYRTVSHRRGQTYTPQPQDFPTEEAPQFTYRPEVHKPQDYRRTMFPMRRAPHGKSHPDPLYRPTKTTGWEKRQGWKTPKATAKTQAKRDKAAQWLAKAQLH